MQLASSARLPDGLLAAQWLGAEKPHQGVSTQKQAWHPAPSVCNSTTALGLRAGCAGNRVRSFYRGEQYDPDLGLYYLRARYYNPATGRFLSRDPNDPELIDEDGNPTDPRYFHKYLYANGDPVRMIDPTGRGAGEYALPIGLIGIPTTKALIAVGGTLGCLILWEGGNVWANSVVASNGGYVMQLPCFALPMSKGGKQKVSHDWVLAMASNMGKDVCAALKQIMQEAKRAGDSTLFLAAKATYKQVCRGYGG